MIAFSIIGGLWRAYASERGQQQLDVNLCEWDAAPPLRLRLRCQSLLYGPAAVDSYISGEGWRNLLNDVSGNGMRWHKVGAEPRRFDDMRRASLGTWLQ